MSDQHIKDSNLHHPSQKIILEENSKGYYSCEIPITKELWLEILNDRQLTDFVRMRMLLSFYFMPGHKATCNQCHQKYGYPTDFYHTGIINFGKAVVKRLGSFSIHRKNDDGQCFWPVAIGIGRNTKIEGSFEWKLRKELIEAIESILIDNAMELYIQDFEQHWDSSNWAEVYKWRAVKWFQNNWDINAPDFSVMLDKALSKTGNLLQSQSSFPRAMIVNMAKADAEFVRSMFMNLYDESDDLIERVNAFVTKSEEMRIKYNDGTWNSHYQTTNPISVYLWLRYPDKYYIYKYSVYRDVNEKLGLDSGIKKGGATEMICGYKMYDKIRKAFLKDDRIRKLIDSHVYGHDDLYDDVNLCTATMDFGFWISKAYTSSANSLKLNNPVNMEPFIKEVSELLKNKKNIILQGAPGTGKTYNTAAVTLAVIDGTVPESHKEVMDRYEQLRKERRIGFTTFHQSMDYEDFIEGIKPYHENGNIIYKVEDGIFTQLCKAAQVASEVSASGTDNLLEGMNENPTIWKVSLESTGDNPTRRDCMKNGHIRIGWSVYGDLDFTEDHPEVTEGKAILRAFQRDMKIGDIVVSCWSQDETDAIGIITGDYEYKQEGGALPRYRDVKWVVKDICHNIKEINHGKHMTLGTVYRLSIDLKDILNIIEAYAPARPSIIKNSEKPYVLIIDEINRGNVSKIFGELITLIEKDKRIGAEHPVTLSLPYSKVDNFGVPQNLYIIGTMNTTDRSTGTIDYAIRRRFAFLTLPAKRDLIESDIARAIFDDVQSFIEKYKYADMDLEDLMVGHSYFMTADDEELSLKIKYEVIPLIKEYIKDGILSIKPDDAKRYFSAWLNLETIDAYGNDNGTTED